LRVKEINKYLVYKEQEAERLEQLERVVGQLEVKVGSVDSFIKRMSIELGKVQEVLHERLGPVMQALD